MSRLLFRRSATYLSAIDPIHFEMQIRPEGICGLLLVLNFFLVLEFVYWRFLRQKERASLVYGLAAVFTSSTTAPGVWVVRG